MIKKIDIIDFGSFQNFIWDDTNKKEFGNRNIVYGRNYSGKTTLSRIFRSIEKKTRHEDFKSGKFEVLLDNDHVINETQIEESNLNVRVYNSDYRDDNLSILYDKGGDITPFTILGEKNIDIEKKINDARESMKTKKEELGSVQDKTGITWEIDRLDSTIEKANNDLNAKLTKKSSEINRDKELFKWTPKKKQYNRTDFVKDIEIAKGLSTIEKDSCKNTINDEVITLITINSQESNEDILTDIISEANEILFKDIKPSKTIDYLLENNDLQQWVKEGVELHREKRDRCAFCQGNLNDELWRKIDQHFTKESEEYRKQIERLIKKVENQLDFWKSNTLVEKEQFYSKFHEKYDDINNKWNDLKSLQVDNLNYILVKLTERYNDIFSTVNFKPENISDTSNEVKECMQELDKIIKENNKYSRSLDSEQNKARISLRLDEIHSYLGAIDYNKQINDIKTRRAERDERYKEENKVSDEIESLNKQIKEWESQINDEQKAVEQVNFYLKSFLGHPELSLEVEKREEGENQKTKFSIKRNKELAYNLSEGEQSLIAFCYFLSNLKDISDPQEYIIFIDDPISSLDGNNLFYVFSLIDSEIARENYKQLFISTHNLDLLKFLQRIGQPTNNDKWKNDFLL